MKSTAKALIGATALLAFAGALAVWVILPYLESRQQFRRVFDAFDLLAASVSAGAGTLEYKHRLVEATAALTRMAEMEPGFSDSPTGRELQKALAYFLIGPEWRDTQKVRSKDILMELSEVELRAPTDEDRRTYRQLLAYGIVKKGDPGSASAWLEPWAAGDAVASAYILRALGRLNNAQIMARRKKGNLYNEPARRKDAEWVKLLPPEHPDVPPPPRTPASSTHSPPKTPANGSHSDSSPTFYIEGQGFLIATIDGEHMDVGELSDLGVAKLRPIRDVAIVTAAGSVSATVTVNGFAYVWNKDGRGPFQLQIEVQPSGAVLFSPLD